MGKNGSDLSPHTHLIVYIGTDIKRSRLEPRYLSVLKILHTHTHNMFIYFLVSKLLFSARFLRIIHIYVIRACVWAHVMRTRIFVCVRAYTSIKYNLRPFYSYVYIKIVCDVMWCDVFFFFPSVLGRHFFIITHMHTFAIHRTVRVCRWNDYGFDPYIDESVVHHGHWYIISRAHRRRPCVYTSR